MTKIDKAVIIFTAVLGISFLIVIAAGCLMMFEGQIRNDQIELSEDRE